MLCSDLGTAACYGDIWAALAAAGQMIPTNDLWIAASAIQHGLPLITNDAHFAHVPGLTMESWY